MQQEYRPAKTGVREAGFPFDNQALQILWMELGGAPRHNFDLYRSILSLCELLEEGSKFEEEGMQPLFEGCSRCAT